jgi:hypothetical protein
MNVTVMGLKREAEAYSVIEKHAENSNMLFQA